MYRIYILSFLLLFISSNKVHSQNNNYRAREGEKITDFLKRNQCTGDENYKKFLKINKEKLGKNQVLKKGVKYTLPKDNTTKTSAVKSSGKQKNKLFGKKYEEYTIKSNRLKGACFFLSSGHGGLDCGAKGSIGQKEIHEDEYAYDITLRLARSLLEEGATVYIIIQDSIDGIRDERYLINSTRETCMGVPIPDSQRKRLTQRSNKINELSRKATEKYQRGVFIHLDSQRDRQVDVYFYHAQKSEAGLKLANTMRKNFQAKYDKFQTNRGFRGTVGSRGLHMLDQTNPVGLFVEVGNINSSFDQRRFIPYENRQALADWMRDGFVQDYRNWKKDR